MNLTPRLAYHEHAPKPMKALLDLSDTIKKGKPDARLVDLALLRVSQLNGCGYCIDMHWRDLVKLGADVRHLNSLAGWRQSPFFSERERAALRWAEIVNADAHHASDDDFTALHVHFSDAEIAELGFVIAVIHAWNVLNASLRNPLPQVVR